MMKKIFKSKITAIALACLLLVGAFAGVYALANGSNDIEITHVTLAYDVEAQISYTISAPGVGADESVVVYFWGVHPTDADEDGIFDEPQLESDDAADNADGTFTAFSQGFAPAQMTQVVYAQAVILGSDGKAVSGSNIVRYSVAEYLFEGLGEGGSATQVALWKSLVNYIEYAQTYLGWTENSKPSDLAYVKVTNGYLAAQDGSGEKYSAGMYAVGGSYTIVPNYTEEEFGAWYRYDTNTYVNSIYSYSPGATANEDYRHYIAVPKSEVTVSGGTVYGLAPSLNGYLPNQSVKAENGTLAVKDHLYVAASAPLTKVEGDVTKHFSHWTDAQGDIVSYNATYIFKPSEVDGKLVAGQSHTLTANYADAPASVTLAYTGNSLNASYDSFDVATGVINSSSRPASEDDSVNYGGGEVNFAGASTLSPATVAERVVYSFNIQVDPRDLAEGESYSGTNHYTDFFINKNSVCHNQIGLGYTTAGRTSGHIFMNVQSTKDDDGNLLGYYFMPCTNSDSTTSIAILKGGYGRMEYGKSYAIDFEIISEVSEDGVGTVDSLNVYIDGLYVGTSVLGTTWKPSYTASGNIYFDIGTLKRTRSKTTITGLTAVEYDR